MFVIQLMLWPWKFVSLCKVRPCNCVKVRVVVVGASRRDGEDWCSGHYLKRDTPAQTFQIRGSAL